jgi:hypothetical protein
MKSSWIFTAEEKQIISSLVAKGQKEQERNEAFAIIDFDSFYSLLDEKEVALVKQYLSIDPKEIGCKTPFLGFQEKDLDLVGISNQTIVNSDGRFVLPTQYLPRETFQAYEKLNAAIRQDLGRGLFVLYGYRSPARQAYIFFDILERIYDFDFKKTVRRVCFPAYSEHVCSIKQAIDFTPKYGGESEDFHKTPEYEWLKNNANKFNFFESYPANNTVDMMYEPWHWHYEPTSLTA